MIMSLASILDQSNSVVMTGGSFTLAQLEEQLNTELTQVPQSEVELEQMVTQMAFLEHAQSQLELVLSRENEAGFTFAAQMTLSALGASMEEKADDAAKPEEEKKEEAKTEAKGRLAKIGGSIMAFIDKIRTALLKFWAEKVSSAGRLTKSANALAEKGASVKDVDAAKEISFNDQVGKDIGEVAKGVAAMSKIDLIVAQKMASSLLSVTNAAELKVEVEKMPGLTELTAAAKSVGVTIEPGLFGPKFVDAKSAVVKVKGVSQSDIDAATKVAKDIAAHLSQYVTQASTLSKNIPFVDEAKKAITAAGDDKGKAFGARTALTVYNNVCTNIGKVQVLVATKQLKTALAYISAGKGAAADKGEEEKKGDKAE